MIYLSDQKEIVEDLKYTVKKIIQKSKSVLEVLAMMEHFMEIKRRMNRPPEDFTFIDFLKSGTAL